MEAFLLCDAPGKGDKGQNETNKQPVTIAILGVLVFLYLCKNNKQSYHVLKFIVVLHVYNKIFGIS